jgi:hypothetical protein
MPAIEKSLEQFRDASGELLRYIGLTENSKTLRSASPLRVGDLK